MTGDRGRLVDDGSAGKEQIGEEPGVLVRPAGRARSEGDSNPPIRANEVSGRRRSPGPEGREGVKRTLHVGRLGREDRGGEAAELVVPTELFEPDLRPGLELPRRHHARDGVGLGVFGEAPAPSSASQWGSAVSSSSMDATIPSPPSGPPGSLLDTDLSPVGRAYVISGEARPVDDLFGPVGAREIVDHQNGEVRVLLRNQTLQAGSRVAQAVRACRRRRSCSGPGTGSAGVSQKRRTGRLARACAESPVDLLAQLGHDGRPDLLPAQALGWYFDDDGADGFRVTVTSSHALVAPERRFLRRNGGDAPPTFRHRCTGRVRSSPRREHPCRTSVSMKPSH